MAAQSLTAKKSNFISSCVVETTNLLAAYNNLKQLRAEWDSEGYSSSITQDDIVGSNVHLTPTILASLMNTFDVINSLIATNTQDIDGSTGYLTNLYNVEG